MGGSGAYQCIRFCIRRYYGGHVSVFVFALNGMGDGRHASVSVFALSGMEGHASVFIFALNGMGGRVACQCTRFCVL